MLRPDRLMITCGVFGTWLEGAAREAETLLLYDLAVLLREQGATGPVRFA